LGPVVIGSIKGSTGEAGLSEIQHAMVSTVARNLFSQDDIDDVAVCSPDKAAAAISDPQIARQVVQGMIALAMLEPRRDTNGDLFLGADQRISDAQVERIVSYADAFGVDVPQIKTFQAIADEDTKRMYFDFFWRSNLRQLAISDIKDQGLRNFVKGMASMRGHGTDDKVADKFRRLEDLPDGTWGKQLVNMYHDLGWDYPGEEHGAPEVTSTHDWVHVISGYPPTAVGELQVNTFMHTCSPNPNSFGLMMLALGLYGVGGITLPTGSFTSQGGELAREDIGELFVEAAMRSRGAGVDLLEGVDHWGQAHIPVEELRHQYNIAPKTHDIGDPDPGVVA
jgi:hypothetical protein